MVKVSQILLLGTEWGTYKFCSIPPGWGLLCLFLWHSKVVPLLKWKRCCWGVLGIFKMEHECVFERCGVGWRATDSFYWFEHKMNLCLKRKGERTEPWGTEDLKPCKNQSLISTGILVGIWSECTPILEFPIQYFGASFFSSRGFLLPSVYHCN